MGEGSVVNKPYETVSMCEETTLITRVLTFVYIIVEIEIHTENVYECRCDERLKSIKLLETFIIIKRKS